MRRLLSVLLALILIATACSSSEQATGDNRNPDPTSEETASPGGEADGDDPASGTDTRDPGGENSSDEGAAQFRRGRLQAFDACDAFLDHMRAEAGERVGAYGLDGGGISIAEFARDGDMVMEGMAVDDAEMSEDASADTASSAPAAPIPDFAESQGSEESGGALYSETNNQVSGVDEPDIVKTDGERIITLTNQTLQVFRVEDDTAVDAGTVTSDFYPNDMLLAGDTVLLLGMSWGEEEGGGGIETTLAKNTGLTMIQQVDISGPPTITNTLRLEGNMVSARRIGTTARIVVSAPPPELGFVYPNGPNGEDAAATANKSIVEESTLDDWMSHYELIDAEGDVTDTGQIVECNRIYYPSEFAGYNLLSVLTVDIAEAITPGNATAVVADGQTVYASAESLYVATTRWPEVLPVEPFDGAATDPAASDPAVTSDDAEANLAEGSPDTAEGSPDTAEGSPDTAEGSPDTADAYTTSIHRFDITDPTEAVYVASGEVTGHLLNQFSLDEYENNLRVATTSGSPWSWGGRDEPESFITVLAPDGDTLNPIGQVGGLGKGEQIYSVRFMGPDAYVVTFRQIDPFYVVDLSEPTKPEVVGELKIPGYSSYLHPVGPDRILGVGQDGTDEGRITGAKASLFDVSDPANPTEIAVWTSTNGNSAVEYDHRAFLWWEQTGQAVLPLTSWEDGYSGAVVLEIDDDSITEQGRIDHAREEEVYTSECSPIEINENYFGPGTTVELCTQDQINSANDRPGFWCDVITEDDFAYGWGEEPGVGDLEIPEGGAVVFCSPENGGLPPRIRRSLVIDDTLWTMSDASVQANDLASLDELSRTDLTVENR